MGIRFVDTAEPMGQFPVALAKHIDFEDGESLQEKLNNGTLGGGGVDLTNYPTTEEMNEAIAAAGHLKREVVLALPVEADADENTIYMIAKLDGSGNQIYDEFMLVNGAFEKIGDTSTDLSGYATETYVTDNAFLMQQDVANAGKFPQVGEDGTVTLVELAGGGTAETTTYANDEHPTLTNVDLALDAILEKIYYVKPQITSFTMTPATTQYEKGQSVASLSFVWAVNKEITTQSLTDCTIELADRAAEFTGPITSNKTFVLNVSDGTESASASKTISFLNRVYWGSAAEPANGTYDSAFITGLSENKLASAKAGEYAFNVAEGQYGYFAIPAAFGNIATFWAFGFEADATDCGEVEFTNQYNHVETYKIFRTGQQGLGSFTATVK